MRKKTLIKTLLAAAVAALLGIAAAPEVEAGSGHHPAASARKAGYGYYPKQYPKKYPPKKYPKYYYSK